MVIKETAEVYRAAGRRFFTKRAAFKAEAWAMIKEKHDCNCTPPDPETGYPGEACWKHSEEALPVFTRLFKWLMRRNKNMAHKGQSRDGRDEQSAARSGRNKRVGTAQPFLVPK